MFQFFRGLIADPGVKIIAIIIGILLWFLASIERSYQFDIEISTEISQPDSGYVLNSSIPDSVRIILVGKGSRLIPIKLQKPSLMINLKNKKSGVYNLSFKGSDLIPEPGKDISVSFIPRKIKVHLVRESRRSVELWVPVVGTPDKDYAICEIQKPKQVLISGTRDLIVGINQVYTETLSVDKAKTEIDTVLKVITPSPLISASPDSIPVVIKIEECAETTFSYLPVTVDRRMNQLVAISPERATILIKGPKSKIEELNQKKIEIKIDVTKLTSGEFYLPAQITLPPGLDLKSSDPKIFKVTIR